MKTENVSYFLESTDYRKKNEEKPWRFFKWKKDPPKWRT